MDNILSELYKQCGVSKEILTQLSEDQKMPFYKLFKNKLDMHKKNTESEIRRKYEEIKKQELSTLTKDIDNTEAMILSILNVGVSGKRRKAVSPELRDNIWNHRYDSNVNAYCRLCDTERITKFTFNNGYIIPEPKGGLTGKINIVPLCPKCYDKTSESRQNLVEILNAEKPIQESEHEYLHKDIVTKYQLFHYDSPNQITFANSIQEMKQCMCLCHSCFLNMNKDYGDILNIDIMKIIGIIKDTAKLDLSSQGGSNDETCYYLDILLLKQYLKLMEPYKEEEPTLTFNFVQNNIHNMDQTNSSSNIIFGTPTWFNG